LIREGRTRTFEFAHRLLQQASGHPVTDEAGGPGDERNGSARTHAQSSSSLALSKVGTENVTQRHVAHKTVAMTIIWTGIVVTFSEWLAEQRARLVKGVIA
jgi:hypothetical protein